MFVIFGITGDLAKVMTFRSLYRLEKRGLLQCPIVGVAVSDWTVDQLAERARESITGTGEQLDEDVFDLLPDCPTCLATLPMRGRTTVSPRRSRAPSVPGVLSRDPTVPRDRCQRTRRGGPHQDRARRRGETFGHDLASVSALAAANSTST